MSTTVHTFTWALSWPDGGGVTGPVAVTWNTWDGRTVFCAPAVWLATLEYAYREAQCELALLDMWPVERMHTALGQWAVRAGFDRAASDWALGQLLLTPEAPYAEMALTA